MFIIFGVKWPIYYQMLLVCMPCLPSTVQLNDESLLTLSRYQKKVLFSGLTSVKKMKIKPLHRLCISGRPLFIIF